MGIGNTRIRMTTAFAKANGADQYDAEEGYGGVWWLRSPGCDYSSDAYIVVHSGIADLSVNVNFDVVGVVPALCLN